MGITDAEILFKALVCSTIITMIFNAHEEVLKEMEDKKDKDDET